MYTLIVALSLADPIADVCVTDCHWFGVSKAVADSNLKAVELFRRGHVQPLQSKDWNMYITLDWRQDRVRDMWQSLADALDERQTDESRIAALRRLRYTVGERDYFAGRIHSPVPPPVGSR